MTLLSVLRSTRITRAHHRLAVHIGQARRRHGWTQRDLAHQMSVSLSTARRIERGDPAVALPLVMCGAVRLGLLREFNRLLGFRLPAHPDAHRAAAELLAMEKVDLSPEAQILLPQGQYGPRLAGHLTLTLGLGHQHLVLGELRQRNSDGVSFASGVSSTFASSTVFTADPSWSKHQRYFMAPPELRADSANRNSSQPKGRWAARSDVLRVLADIAPSGFGARVIQRARDRGLLMALRPFGQRPSAFDGLCMVLDIARQGALRVRPHGEPLSDVAAEQLLLPRLGDLNAMAVAVRAFEQGTEDQRQLLLLMYAATALPGERPKCTWIDGEGRLAVATFGRASDTWAVNRGEVLAMHLASKAGIDVVDAKLLHPVGDPILLTLRLDRSADGTRSHVLSAHNLMRATVSHVVDHLDLLKVMRRYCLDFGVDGPKLWKRLVFKCLIHDTSDDLRKIDFVHVCGDRWSLAPAIGMRPRLSPVDEPRGDQPHGTGHRVTLSTLVEKADAFGVDPAQVRLYLRDQLNILSCWKQWATEFFVNMRAHHIQQIEPAMNNPQTQWARKFLTT